MSAVDDRMDVHALQRHHQQLPPGGHFDYDPATLSRVLGRSPSVRAPRPNQQDSSVDTRTATHKTARGIVIQDEVEGSEMKEDRPTDAASSDSESYDSPPFAGGDGVVALPPVDLRREEAINAAADVEYVLHYMQHGGDDCEDDDYFGDECDTNEENHGAEPAIFGPILTPAAGGASPAAHCPLPTMPRRSIAVAHRRSLLRSVSSGPMMMKRANHHRDGADGEDAVGAADLRRAQVTARLNAMNSSLFSAARNDPLLRDMSRLHIQLRSQRSKEDGGNGGAALAQLKALEEGGRPSGGGASGQSTGDASISGASYQSLSFSKTYRQQQHGGEAASLASAGASMSMAQLAHQTSSSKYPQHQHGARAQSVAESSSNPGSLHGADHSEGQAPRYHHTDRYRSAKARQALLNTLMAERKVDARLTSKGMGADLGPIDAVAILLDAAKRMQLLIEDSEALGVEEGHRSAKEAAARRRAREAHIASEVTRFWTHAPAALRQARENPRLYDRADALELGDAEVTDAGRSQPSLEGNTSPRQSSPYRTDGRLRSPPKKPFAPTIPIGPLLSTPNREGERMEQVMRVLREVEARAMGMCTDGSAHIPSSSSDDEEAFIGLVVQHEQWDAEERAFEANKAAERAHEEALVAQLKAEGVPMAVIEASRRRPSLEVGTMGYYELEEWREERKRQRRLSAAAAEKERRLEAEDMRLRDEEEEEAAEATSPIMHGNTRRSRRADRKDFEEGSSQPSSHCDDESSAGNRGVVSPTPPPLFNTQSIVASPRRGESANGTKSPSRGGDRSGVSTTGALTGRDHPLNYNLPSWLLAPTEVEMCQMVEAFLKHRRLRRERRIARRKAREEVEAEAGDACSGDGAPLAAPIPPHHKLPRHFTRYNQQFRCPSIPNAYVCRSRPSSSHSQTPRRPRQLSIEEHGGGDVRGPATNDQTVLEMGADPQVEGRGNAVGSESPPPCAKGPISDEDDHGGQEGSAVPHNHADRKEAVRLRAEQAVRQYQEMISAVEARHSPASPRESQFDVCLSPYHTNSLLAAYANSASNARAATRCNGSSPYCYVPSPPRPQKGAGQQDGAGESALTAAQINRKRIERAAEIAKERDAARRRAREESIAAGKGTKPTAKKSNVAANQKRSVSPRRQDSRNNPDESNEGGGRSEEVVATAPTKQRKKKVPPLPTRRDQCLRAREALVARREERGEPAPRPPSAAGRMPHVVSKETVSAYSPSSMSPSSPQRDSYVGRPRPSSSSTRASKRGLEESRADER